MKNGKWLQFLKILVLGVGIAGLLGSVGQQGPARGSTPTTIAIMTTADLQSAVAPYTVEHEGNNSTWVDWSESPRWHEKSVARWMVLFCSHRVMI